MRRFLGALVGMVIGTCGAFVLGIGLPMFIPISQAEGAYMMGVVFFWVPLAAVAGAVIGVVLGGRARG
ncbi:MAG: hypothetical protein ACK4HF_10155 [Paracoccaceae bacterium]